MLDEQGRLKIVDFSGSGIDGKSALVTYNFHSKEPWSAEPTKKTDIFALASAMYEMATGYLPYYSSSPALVQHHFRERLWPSDLNEICNQEYAQLIRDCWELSCYRADSVEKRLRNIRLPQPSPCVGQHLTGQLSPSLVSPTHPQHGQRAWGAESQCNIKSEQSYTPKSKSGKKARSRHGAKEFRRRTKTRRIFNYFSCNGR